MPTDPPDAPPFWRSACRVFACFSLALIVVSSLVNLQTNATSLVLGMVDGCWSLLVLPAALLGLKGASRAQKLGLWLVALGALLFAAGNLLFCLVVVSFPKC
jgi:hypothetical protein